MSPPSGVAHRRRERSRTMRHRTTSPQRCCCHRKRRYRTLGCPAVVSTANGSPRRSRQSGRRSSWQWTCSRTGLWCKACCTAGHGDAVTPVAPGVVDLYRVGPRRAALARMGSQTPISSTESSKVTIEITSQLLSWYPTLSNPQCSASCRCSTRASGNRPRLVS